MKNKAELIKKTNFKISVIVSAYNCEKYITRLVESVISQSYQNFELIIVNDGSTDNTLKKINQIKSSKLIIIDKKNTGVSDSRNIGMKKSSGELITFMDADDYVDSNYFDTIIKYFCKYPKIDVLGFGYYSNVEDNNLNIISNDDFHYKEFFYKNKEMINKDLVELWDKKMLYNIWNKVYKKTIIENNEISFYNENWGEDVDFNIKYMKKTTNFYMSDKIFYHYIRERAGAATNRYRENFFDIRKSEYRNFNKYFEDNGIKYDEYIEFSSRRFIECVLGVIENIYCSNMSVTKRYCKIKQILNDNDVKKAAMIAQPKTTKTKIMLIPVKKRNVFLTMIMGKTVHIIKVIFPGLFNHLKNNR